MHLFRSITFALLVVLLSSQTCHAKQKSAVKADSLTILIVKGDSCLAHFDYYHASVYYQRANGLSPTVSTTRKLANVRRRMGQNRECTKLLRSLPEDSVSYRDLRTLYFAYKSLGDRDSIFFYGDSIAKLNSYDSDVIVSLATYCNDTQIPQKAVELCSCYLKGDSLNLLVSRQLGYANYLCGNYEEAFHIYKTLIDKGFDNFESTFIVGMSARELDYNYSKDAHDYLLRAATFKNFKDFTTLLNLEKACQSLALNNEAIKYAKIALDLLMPDSARVYAIHEDLAETYLTLCDYENAVREFETCSLLKPNSPYLYYCTAQIYGTLGNKEKERENYTKFLNMSYLLRDDGRKKQAVKAVREYLRKHLNFN